MKGKLDVTTFAALAHGGKTGAGFVANEPQKSLLVQQVSGDEPEMPEKGEKLSGTEVSLLSRWIAQGAHDDSTPSQGTADLDAPRYPTTYAVAPVISAMAVLPGGGMLAVGGYHEVLLQHADGSGLIARLPCQSAHLTSLCFTPDGTRLIAAGGSPGESGRIDVFNVPEHKPLNSYAIASDTLFGLSLSPSGDRAAVGCADKSARVISLDDGKELDPFHHLDRLGFGNTI